MSVTSMKSSDRDQGHDQDGGEDEGCVEPSLRLEHLEAEAGLGSRPLSEHGADRRVGGGDARSREDERQGGGELDTPEDRRVVTRRA